MINRLNYYYLFSNEVYLFKDSLPDSNKKHNILLGIIMQILTAFCVIGTSIIYKEKCKINPKLLGVSRSQTGIDALRKIYSDDINILSDLGLRKPMSRYLSFRKVLKVSVFSVKDALTVLLKMYHDNTISAKVYNYYLFRLVHTYNYYYSLYYITIDANLVYMYSSQIVDRYAFLEKEITRCLNMKRICIPHGLEPLIKLPNVFPADVFYCHSAAACNYLSELYGKSCFEFSDEVVRRLMSFNKKNKTRNRIVFFTQPHSSNMTEKTIEYLKYLLKYVEQSKFYSELCVKFHPADNKEYYMEKLGDINVLTDLSDAVSSSVCISFFSTCLLEAIYNNSVSISIYEKSLDIPLCEVSINPNIIKVSNKEELYKILDEYSFRQS